MSCRNITQWHYVDVDDMSARRKVCFPIKQQRKAVLTHISVYGQFSVYRTALAANKWLGTGFRQVQLFRVNKTSVCPPSPLSLPVLAPPQTLGRSVTFHTSLSKRAGKRQDRDYLAAQKVYVFLYHFTNKGHKRREKAAAPFKHWLKPLYNATDNNFRKKMTFCMSRLPYKRTNESDWRKWDKPFSDSGIFTFDSRRTC